MHAGIERWDQTKSITYFGAVMSIAVCSAGLWHIAAAFQDFLGTCAPPASLHQDRHAAIM
jgi:hypothetical protein